MPGSRERTSKPLRFAVTTRESFLMVGESEEDMLESGMRIKRAPAIVPSR
jgi:hypothetical protein